MLVLVVHVLSHISFAILLCEHAGLHILLIRGHPFLALIVWFFFFCQMDGQECLRTSSSYLCFSHLNSIHATSQSLIKSDSNTLCEEHSESPIHHRHKLPKPLCDSRSDRFLHFGPTEIIKLIWVFHLGATDLNFSVTPSCSNCLQFCISVPPSCSTRSHRQGRDIYISTGEILEITSNPLSPCVSCSASSGIWIISLLPTTSRHWILLRHRRRSKH